MSWDPYNENLSYFQFWSATIAHFSPFLGVKQQQNVVSAKGRVYARSGQFYTWYGITLDANFPRLWLHTTIKLSLHPYLANSLGPNLVAVHAHLPPFLAAPYVGCL